MSEVDIEAAVEDKEFVAAFAIIMGQAAEVWLQEQSVKYHMQHNFRGSTVGLLISLQ